MVAHILDNRFIYFHRLEDITNQSHKKQLDVQGGGQLIILQLTERLQTCNVLSFIEISEYIRI